MYDKAPLRMVSLTRIMPRSITEEVAYSLQAKSASSNGSGKKQYFRPYFLKRLWFKMFHFYIIQQILRVIAKTRLRTIYTFFENPRNSQMENKRGKDCMGKDRL